MTRSSRKIDTGPGPGRFQRVAVDRCRKKRNEQPDGLGTKVTLKKK